MFYIIFYPLFFLHLLNDITFPILINWCRKCANIVFVRTKIHNWQKTTKKYYETTCLVRNTLTNANAMKIIYN